MNKSLTNNELNNEINIIENRMNAAKMTFDITKDEYANICDIIDSINVSINSLEEEKNTKLNDIKKIKKVNKFFISIVATAVTAGITLFGISVFSVTSSILGVFSSIMFIKNNAYNINLIDKHISFLDKKIDDYSNKESIERTKLAKINKNLINSFDTMNEEKELIIKKKRERNSNKYIYRSNVNNNNIQNDGKISEKAYVRKRVK